MIFYVEGSVKSNSSCVEVGGKNGRVRKKKKK